MKEHAQFKVVYAWLKREKKMVSETDSICLPCVKQIQQNHENRDFTPHWLPKPQILPIKCNMEYCQASVYAQTSLVAVDELERILKERVSAFMVSIATQSIGLCREHYQRMYVSLHQSTLCNSCGAMPKKGEVFSRHRGSPSGINGYLSHISSEPSSLTSSSTMCLPCYEYFQSIIAQEKEANPVVVAKDIDTILTSLSEQVKDVRLKGERIESSEFYEMVMCIVTQTLANAMKADEAMLLSALYQLFVHKVHTEVKHYPMLHPVKDKNIPKKRWVLSRLYFYFGDALAAACMHVCYGTLFYHRKCDLLKALSAALGKGRTYKMAASSITTQKPLTQQRKSTSNCSSQGKEPVCHCSIEDQTDRVSLYLNEKLHRQAKALIPEQPTAICHI